MTHAALRGLDLPSRRHHRQRGVATWLACDCSLAGIVLLRDERGSRLRKLRRECRRVGWARPFIPPDKRSINRGQP